MNLAGQILDFYASLRSPKNLPKTVKVMNPYQDFTAQAITKEFYEKFYDDTQSRIVLFGINPGRFGGGITGIPFTDPVVLAEECGIENPFEKRAELSSKFIYEMIDAYGDTKDFYQHCYISAMSPLGFVENNKNLNYYDIPKWKSIFEKYSANLIKAQLPFIRRDIAYSIGKGNNFKFLKSLNDQYQFFEKVEELPHPRWVMQYRLKRKSEFIQEYLDKLKSKIQ
ncbi:MAG: DUF4918 family protein [Cyclobacteriaceae bacterium]